MARYRKVAATVADVRQAPGNAEVTVEPADAPASQEVPYRDLQAQAKEAGIPANQSREDLQAALDQLL